MPRLTLAIFLIAVCFCACSDTPETTVPCAPETDAEICQQLGAECGTVAFEDRCQNDRTLSCGICADGESCRENSCECSPKNDAELCREANADCGQLTVDDNCGTSRTVNCGGCAVGSECGSTTPNVCGCPCLIDQRCYPENAINPDNPCLFCIPSLSENSWSVSPSTACDDEDLCTENDVCTVDGLCIGEPKICTAPDECSDSTCDSSTGTCAVTNIADGSRCSSDQIACTNDVCIAGVCTHDVAADRCYIDDTCYVATQAGPQNPCDVCDPSQSTTTFSVGDQIPCDDGDGLVCTFGTCQAGTCTPEVDPTFCVINNACVLQGERDPNNPCMECDPSRDVFDYSPLDALPCQDGDGLNCTDGVCAAGVCEPTLQPDWCLVNAQCLFRGTEVFYCRVCDPDDDPFALTPINGGVCGQNGMCTCQNGACRSAGGQFCL